MGSVALRVVLEELLQVLFDVANKASTFKPALTHLESTLQAIIPRLDEITRLDSQMGKQKKSDMKELIAITNHGKALVLECSNISCFNIVGKAQLSNELIELDNSIVRHINIILPLEQYKLSMEILQVELKNGERLGMITTMIVIVIVGLVAAATIKSENFSKLKSRASLEHVVGGAILGAVILGAAVAQLLKWLLDAKKKTSSDAMHID